MYVNKKKKTIESNSGTVIFEDGELCIKEYNTDKVIKIWDNTEFLFNVWRILNPDYKINSEDLDVIESIKEDFLYDNINVYDWLRKHEFYHILNKAIELKWLKLKQN